MKKILLPFIAILLFVSCKKDINTEKEQAPYGINAASNEKSSKISICHKTSSPTNPWLTIQINPSDLPNHLAHGDVVPDADGDGYTKENPCGIGTQNDCNDDNAAINPGATEVCDNGIDDNCNGQIDENCIPSVTICNQVWMLKNLDVTKYRNGDDIPQVTDQTAWNNLTTGAWCYYANSTANGTTYGKLYNWVAVNDARGLAPAGWHVPSNAEWTTLINCLGGFSAAESKMKEAGNAHWQFGGGSNSSGFTALPGGWRPNTTFSGIGRSGYWWSSTGNTNTGTASQLSLELGAQLAVNTTLMITGLSVRCVKD